MGMPVTAPRYTVDDLERFPDDGNRYELLDGQLLVTPSPSLFHQVVATRLALAIGDVVMRSGVGHVVGPGVVTTPPLTQLHPDILVFPARFSPDSKWVDIDEHWLAVEIISRSSRVYDREFKRDAYLALGVREVWLVDPRAKAIEVCRERGSGVVESSALTSPRRALARGRVVAATDACYAATRQRQYTNA
jgi:Uma2 family endonuclease